MNMAEKIHSLRKQKHISQEALGQMLSPKVNRAAISKWENGRGLPDYEYLSDLCKELDITFNEFIADEKIESKDSEIKLEENSIFPLIAILASCDYDF